MTDRPARSFRIAACVVAAVIAGCTPAASEQAGSASPATSPTSAGPTEAATPSPEQASYLQRRDTPPEGVAAQFEYFGQGGDGPLCEGLDESVPGVFADGAPPEVASHYRLCVMGMGAGVPIDVVVTPPDGNARTYTIGAESAVQGRAILELELFPGEPLGVYNVTATQELTQASGSYEVVRSSSPRGISIPPNEGPPGTTFGFALAGFPPHSDVELDLYRYRIDGELFIYVTTLAPVATDSFGEATYQLPTVADDPAGFYCLVFRLATERVRDICERMQFRIRE